MSNVKSNISMPNFVIDNLYWFVYINPMFRTATKTTYIAKSYTKYLIYITRFDKNAFTISFNKMRSINTKHTLAIRSD